jgi:hypothetical protein
LPFDELAAFEAGAGADEGDEVGCVDRATAGLGGLDEFERHGQAGGLGAGAFGDLGAVANVDSIGLVVRTWIKRSAGKS